MTVLLESLDAGVLELTLHRPEKRNALSPELVDALRAALRRAREDPDVRSVLLLGAGPAFCAGGDFDAMRARRGDAMATKTAQDERFAALARDVLCLEKPVVAAAHGDAFGAGLMLVLAADHAVAAPGARFAATFVKVGLVPDTAGSWLLPKTLGLRDARRLALLPDPVDARKAESMGLVSEVAEDAQARAREVARRWAEGPTLALGLAKRAIVMGTSDDLDAALAREANLQALMFTTQDHAEGVDAFVEKRPPRFRGA
ncbi:MAG TPA: enoyl-CoA hydratase-related protein [Candidatus Thermoplasmatota archaeon]|nr:enoyl-CoA hydratase-related protein [Candidatus Thermoplasmatota archaeon]